MSMNKQKVYEWVKAGDVLPKETSARIAWRFTNKAIGGLGYLSGKGFRRYGEQFTRDYKNIEYLSPRQAVILDDGEYEALQERIRTLEKALSESHTDLNQWT